MLYVSLSDAQHMVDKANLYGEDASPALKNQLENMSVSERRLMIAQDNFPILPLWIRWTTLILAIFVLILGTIFSIERVSFGSQNQAHRASASGSRSAMESQSDSSP